MQKGAAILLFSALFAASAAEGQSYRPEDESIRCNDDSSCGKLIGKRLWVTINNNEICESLVVPKNCRSIRPGYGVTVVGMQGQGVLDRYFYVKTQEGTTGYINVANAHLLTYTDPKPAEEARRKQAALAAEKRRKQAEADAVALAAMPLEQLQKTCILAAAERLPKIPGLEILGSRTVPMLESKKPAPDIYMTIVEIEAKAAGVNETYKFLCARGARTPAMVQALTR